MTGWPAGEGVSLDTSVPHIARVYDYWLGGKDNFAADRAAADKLTPSDPFDYIYRGLGRMKADPAAALADFEKAAELNPHSVCAWQNQASVLSDRLGRVENALAAQQQAVAAAPEHGRARAGRAVLYARLGRRADAHTDA